ncbi:hypothetical protein RclHR1_17080002 [Rhizophagus clarus]|uniref:Uncharacterized protein n=1 Tax=Rhizophagus clarus TaxID=94130 RepID=A0A2Z6QJ76_9GLOM|nr:hypothetical protein RclHR1_17080002 [Rhizophagus clarus]GES81478.1 hypothetical protein GLOIN_2v1771351 [Rhizophagus clarus]
MGNSKPNKDHSKSRAPNAWIMFSNDHHILRKRREGKKGIKRSDTMRFAKDKWDTMSNEEKSHYFLKWEQMQIEETNKHLNGDKLNLSTNDGFINITPHDYTLLQESKKNKKIVEENFNAYINKEACI